MSYQQGKGWEPGTIVPMRQDRRTCERRRGIPVQTPSGLWLTMAGLVLAGTVALWVWPDPPRLPSVQRLDSGPVMVDRAHKRIVVDWDALGADWELQIGPRVKLLQDWR